MNDAVFIYLKQTLKSAARIAYLKGSHIVSTFTDASEKSWAGLITQSRGQEADFNIQEQKQEQEQVPLYFLGGQFPQTQESWMIYKRKAFAIVMVLERMDYILLAQTPCKYILITETFYMWSLLWHFTRTNKDIYFRKYIDTQYICLNSNSELDICIKIIMCLQIYKQDG